MTTTSEAGFSLLETIVATGIVAVGIGGMLAALVSVERPVEDTIARTRLTMVAENALTDVRAALAYDNAGAAQAVNGGLASEFVVPDSVAGPVTCTVHLVAGSAVRVLLACSNDRGASATIDTAFPTAVPVPGSHIAVPRRSAP
jgi:Tfp pilus assembly protein PilV